MFASFPDASPERKAGQMIKNRAASCLGKRPCFDFESKKAQASLPALLDYAKLSPNRHTVFSALDVQMSAVFTEQKLHSFKI